jgi:hypothetical protein
VVGAGVVCRGPGLGVLVLFMVCFLCLGFVFDCVGEGFCELCGFGGCE